LGPVQNILVYFLGRGENQDDVNPRCSKLREGKKKTAGAGRRVTLRHNCRKKKHASKRPGESKGM